MTLPEEKLKTLREIISGYGSLVIAFSGGLDSTFLLKVASEVPSVTLSRESLKQGYWVVKLISDAGLVSSNNEARRLIDQGGCYIDEKRIESVELTLQEEDLSSDSIILRAGKKRYRKVIFQ